MPHLQIKICRTVPRKRLVSRRYEINQDAPQLRDDWDRNYFGNTACGRPVVTLLGNKRCVAGSVMFRYLGWSVCFKGAIFFTDSAQSSFEKLSFEARHTRCKVHMRLEASSTSFRERRREPDNARIKSRFQLRAAAVFQSVALRQEKNRKVATPNALSWFFKRFQRWRESRGQNASMEHDSCVAAQRNAVRTAPTQLTTPVAATFLNKTCNHCQAQNMRNARVSITVLPRTTNRLLQWRVGPSTSMQPQRYSSPTQPMPPSRDRVTVDIGKPTLEHQLERCCTTKQRVRRTENGSRMHRRRSGISPSVQTDHTSYALHHLTWARADNSTVVFGWKKKRLTGDIRNVPVNRFRSSYVNAEAGSACRQRATLRLTVTSSWAWRNARLKVRDQFSARRRDFRSGNCRMKWKWM